MTTRLARVLYDTVIETVEHRMRQDGWIQEDHIQQKEGEHAQADSSGDDDTMTHAMVERGNKRCRKTASTADDSRAANGSTSGGLNGSPAKQSSSHKDKPPASKISEDVLQKIISRWHEKITETEAAPPVVRTLNTQRYSRTDLANEEIDKEDVAEETHHEQAQEEKQEITLFSPEGNLNKDSYYVSNPPLWAPNSIQSCCQTRLRSDTDDQNVTIKDTPSLHTPEIQEKDKERQPFEEEGDDDLELLFQECSTMNQKENRLQKTHSYENVYDDDKIDSDLDDSEVEDALQGPVSVQRIRKGKESRSLSEDNGKSLLVAKSVELRKKRKHKLTIQLGPGIISIGGVDLIFSRCKLELDTKGSSATTW